MKEKIVVSVNYGEQGVSPVEATRQAVQALQTAGYSSEAVIAHASTAHTLRASKGVSSGFQLSISDDPEDTSIQTPVSVNLRGDERVPESVVLVRSGEQESSIKASGLDTIQLGELSAARAVYGEDKPAYDSVLLDAISMLNPDLNPGEKSGLSTVDDEVTITMTDHIL